MNLTQSTVSNESFKTPINGFVHLPKFIHYILENKLEEFIREQLAVSREVDAPILKYFSSIPDEQLIQMSIEPTREFWMYLVNGDIETQINDTLDKWKKNQLPLISRDHVVADDITKGNYVRKVVLTKFLSGYTTDPNLFTIISVETDYYLQILTAKSFKTYIDIQNEKLDAINSDLQRREEQLLEAQSIANMGSFEWDLTDAGNSKYTAQLFHIFQLEAPSKLEDFMHYVHEEDREKLNNAVKHALTTGELYECEYRYQKNGTEKLIWSRGKVRFENNKPVALHGTVMDVTERHRFLDELKRRDELYKQSQALTHIGDWTWDLETNKISWSDEMYRIYGLEPQSEEITFDRFLSFLHPEDREKRVQQITRSLETLQTEDHNMRIITVDGTQKTLKGKSKFTINSQGKATKLTGSCQDVTSEALLQKNLERENKFAEALINSTEDVITAFDKNLNVITLNNRAEKRFKVKRAEALGKYVLDVFPFMKGTVHFDDLCRALKGERSYYPESKSLISDEYFERYVIPLTNSQGEVFAVVSLGHDITKTKENSLRISELNLSLEQKNEMLRRSEEQHQKMIAEVQDYAIILLDRDGFILNWNLGAEKIKGYKTAEIIGKGFDIFYTPEDREGGLAQRLLTEATTTGRAIHEGWRVRKDGTRFWGSVVITALHDAENTIIGFSKVTRDLSERKLAEEQLKQNNILLQQLNQSLEIKNQLLEKSNKELSAFSYVASHDLQEPLRKIKTFANMIIEKNAEELVPRHKDLLGRIMTASNNMQRLIEDLLTYSRTHNAPHIFETVDLNDLVKTCCNELSSLLKEGSISFDIKPLPKVQGIPFQLTQLFENLIGNAIKYARHDVPAHITIEAETVLGKNLEQPVVAPDKTFNLIKVTDNGIGFEQQYAEKIFEPFQRLHGKNEYSGTGIGLAICKKIVQNHDGVIYAKSEAGKGSAFYIAIPASKQS
ncbi:MAG: PAS domain S-box protein [Chitinophagales bacterium]